MGEDGELYYSAAETGEWGAGGGGRGRGGVANVELVGGEEDEEMIDAVIENAENATVGDLDQFQWP